MLAHRLTLLSYWDWTMDWMNLQNSSVWDALTGFGGDGDSQSPETVGGGRCVTDGPFTQLRPILYNHTYTKHCLSRGFRDGEILGRLPGASFSPEIIGNITRKASYEEFVKDIEYRLHNVMHVSIAGDFLALTAANGMAP
jgi:tyrosinase